MLHSITTFSKKSGKSANTADRNFYVEAINDEKSGSLSAAVVEPIDIKAPIDELNKKLKE